MKSPVNPYDHRFHHRHLSLFYFPFISFIAPSGLRNLVLNLDSPFLNVEYPMTNSEEKVESGKEKVDKEKRLWKSAISKESYSVQAQAHKTLMSTYYYIRCSSRKSYRPTINSDREFSFTSLYFQKLITWPIIIIYSFSLTPNSQLSNPVYKWKYGAESYIHIHTINIQHFMYCTYNTLYMKCQHLLQL